MPFLLKIDIQSPSWDHNFGHNHLTIRIQSPSRDHNLRNTKTFRIKKWSKDSRDHKIQTNIESPFPNHMLAKYHNTISSQVTNHDHIMVHRNIRMRGPHKFRKMGNHNSYRRGRTTRYHRMKHNQGPNLGHIMSHNHSNIHSHSQIQDRINFFLQVTRPLNLVRELNL